MRNVDGGGPTERTGISWIPGSPKPRQKYCGVDREDTSSMVTAGATANTTVKNSRASRESGLLCSHSHGESIGVRLVWFTNLPPKNEASDSVLEQRMLRKPPDTGGGRVLLFRYLFWSTNHPALRRRHCSSALCSALWCGYMI